MLKQDYERFKTLIPEEIFQMTCDEGISSTCEASSKEANASIKRFMKENKINKTMFGQMIGIKKGSTVSYTDSRLKSKKNYYYKVRAYRTVNGKNVYGSYSAVKKVKTK